MTPADVANAEGRHTTTWHIATVAAVRHETANARRIELQVEQWPGNEAGQHLDLRLSADDGYQATRSYSISSVGSGTRVELLVDRVSGGEVSPFLVEDLAEGDQLEARGPLGGWFVWRPGSGDRPVQLIAGGSGIVPMIAILRARSAAQDLTPFRLLNAVRSPDDFLYFRELAQAANGPSPVRVDNIYSRQAPSGAIRPPHRLTRSELADAAFPPGDNARIFICGSTAFVEQVLTWLGDLGHDLSGVRAERFGGS